jgi:imidazolonepropionase-like amidohydrolase
MNSKREVDGRSFNRGRMTKLVFVIAMFVSLVGGGNAQIIALTGATIIDGNGGKPVSDGVVIVSGKKILAIGSRTSVSIPAGARRIDETGKYIVPGLMDGNVHLIPWPSWSYIEFLARYENNFEGIIEEAAQIALKHGFTTVFDSMGPLRPLMHVRDRIDRGEVVGSRMFVAGDIVGFRAVFTTLEAMKSATPAFQKRINDMFELNVGQDLPWKSADQVGEEMRKYVALGPDFVKIGVSGDGRPVNSEIGQDAVLRFTPEQLRAMVKAVHEAGKIIQAHQTSAEALRIVVESGFDMTQHCAITGPVPMYEATIKLMLERKFYCGTQWAPLSDKEEQEVRDQNFTHTGRGQSLDYSVENAVRMIKAGVPQLVSTDAGTIDPDVAKDPNGLWGGLGGEASLIGEAEFLDMKAMQQRGMTPMMIIEGTTKNLAAAYHKLDQFGTLEPGKIADLLVVDADPLQDVQNMRKVLLVMKDGAVIDINALPYHPILTSSEATNPGAVRMK